MNKRKMDKIMNTFPWITLVIGMVGVLAIVMEQKTIGVILIAHSTGFALGYLSAPFLNKF